MSLLFTNHYPHPISKIESNMYMCSKFRHWLTLVSHDPTESSFIHRLKGKVLLKGRRITDTNDDYQHGSVYDTDSDDDSEIEEEHTIVERDRDDKPVCFSQKLLYYLNLCVLIQLRTQCALFLSSSSVQRPLQLDRFRTQPFHQNCPE